MGYFDRVCPGRVPELLRRLVALQPSQRLHPVTFSGIRLAIAILPLPLSRVLRLNPSMPPKQVYYTVGETIATASLHRLRSKNILVSHGAAGLLIAVSTAQIAGYLHDNFADFFPEFAVTSETLSQLQRKSREGIFLISDFANLGVGLSLMPTGCISHRTHVIIAVSSVVGVVIPRFLEHLPFDFIYEYSYFDRDIALKNIRM